MANTLKKIFTGNDQVNQTFVINAWHVSQSVDAFTGEYEYNITLSGSFMVTGSTLLSGSTTLYGTPDVDSGYSTLVLDSTTGEVKKGQSVSAGDTFLLISQTGSIQIDTGSLIETASVSGNIITFTEGDGNTFAITIDTGSATSGTSGINGSTGPAGTSGVDGGTGPAGTSGTSGINSPGAAGTSGTSGVDGAAGATGTSGTSGISGTSVSGSAGCMSYELISDTGDPSTGQANYNVFAIASITTWKFFNTDDDSTDQSNVLGALQSAGGTLTVTWDNGNDGTYLINSGSTAGNVYSFDVTYQSGNGSAPTSPSTGTNNVCYVANSNIGGGGGSGTSGTSGISSVGTSGTSGIDGAVGATGTSGTSGTSGTTTLEVAGTSGTSGLTGTSGTSGVDGAAGATGTSGTSGADGATGATGTSGTSGASGTSGTSPGGGTPGGNNTEVQYNDNGAFGGDSGFTYDETNNVVTIQAASGQPALILDTLETSIVSGSEIASIDIQASDDLTGGVNVAEIKITADSTLSPPYTGQASIEFKTLQSSDNGTPKTGLLVSSSRAIMFNQYGAGNYTGTEAYALSIDSEGKVIEVTPPSTGNGDEGYSIPAEERTINFSIDETISSMAVSISGGTPAATDNVIAFGNADVTTTSTFNINTGSYGYAFTRQLLNHTGTNLSIQQSTTNRSFKVTSVIFQPYGMTIGYDNTAVGGSGTYSEGATNGTVQIDVPYYHATASAGYNKWLVRNYSDTVSEFVIAPPTASVTSGDSVIIEIEMVGASQNDMEIYRTNDMSNQYSASIKDLAGSAITIGQGHEYVTKFMFYSSSNGIQGLSTLTATRMDVQNPA